VLALIDAIVAGEEGAAQVQLIEDVREESVELWRVQRAEEALKVAMHPCGQPPRELPRALDLDSATDAVRPKQVAEQRRQLTQSPSEDGVVPQSGGSPEHTRNSKGRKCIARRCSAPRNIACRFPGATK